MNEINLLESELIPVVGRKVGIREFLSSKEKLEVVFPRDDFVFATLKLIICLAQVLFAPKDEAERERRIEEGLTVEEYDEKARKYRDYFAVNYGDNRFMQSKVDSKAKFTRIQKLMIGLPEGNNPAHFNNVGEVKKICSCCAAIALFNQASNGTMFGGGFKAPLPGITPVSTFLLGKSLQETVWINTLTQPVVDEFYGNRAKNQPTWVDTIEAESKLPASQIGLLRGLFFQPCLIELDEPQDSGPDVCDLCGYEADRLHRHFQTQKFRFAIEGYWDHPHSPKKWDKKGSADQARVVQFTTPQPTWTDLPGCLYSYSESKFRVQRALVIEHGPRKSEYLEKLLIGGYRAKQAAIKERRHDVYGLPVEWQDKKEDICFVITTALEIKAILNNKLFGFAKEQGFSTNKGSLNTLATSRYLSAATPILETYIAKADDDDDAMDDQSKVLRELVDLAKEIFEVATRQYVGASTKTLKSYLYFKMSFDSSIKKLELFD